jgi:hypothetical protein
LASCSRSNRFRRRIQVYSRTATVIILQFVLFGEGAV